jgi:2'-5' RNA ligase
VNQDQAATRRLFFALWPDEGVRRQLAAAARRWCRKPVSDDKLHITLIFLGDQDGEQQTCCAETAAGVRGAGFELELDYLGFWPRAGIQWLGSSRVPPALPALVEALGGALAAACDYQPERRPFVPHVTLARRVRRAPVKAGLEAIHWPVSDFALVESVMVDGRPLYRVLQRWPLDEPGESR